MRSGAMHVWARNVGACPAKGVDIDSPLIRRLFTRTANPVGETLRNGACCVCHSNGRHLYRRVRLPPVHTRSERLRMPSSIARASRADLVGAGRPIAAYFARARCRWVRTVLGAM